jgi:hypothetical protein
MGVTNRYDKLRVQAAARAAIIECNVERNKRKEVFIQEAMLPRWSVFGRKARTRDEALVYLANVKRFITYMNWFYACIYRVDDQCKLNSILQESLKVAGWYVNLTSDELQLISGHWLDTAK